MQLSARNQLKGQIVRVKSGAVMAEVEVKVKAGKVGGGDYRCLSQAAEAGAG